MNNRVLIPAVAGLILAALIVGGIVASGAFRGGETLVIATSTDYPPFSYLDAEGNPAGFDYEYGNLLCASLKAECQWQTDTFENIFERTEREEFDLVINSFTRTAYREQVVHFSDPYYRSYGQFVRRAGSAATPAPAPDGSGVVAVQSGTIYEKYLELPRFDRLEKETFENQDEAFLAVAEGRADLTIADDVITDLAVNQSPFLRGGQLGPFERVGERIVPVPGTPEFEALGAGEIGIVVPKSNAHLLPGINRAIREINQGSAIAAISEGYFGRNIVAR